MEFHDPLINNIEESLNSSRNNLLQIHNIEVVLEHKYVLAKQAILETINNVEKEFISELDDIQNNKLEALEEIEKSILEHCSRLKSANEPSSAERVLQKIEESTVSSDFNLLSFLTLDFVTNDCSMTKNALGYIKSSLNKPEELKLSINDSFHIGGELQVFVTGKRPWYPLLINSLVGYIQDAKGNKQKGILKDMGDSDYFFTFNLDNLDKCSLYTVSITLYGHQINNSPWVFEFSYSKKDIENTRKNTCNDVADKNEELGAVKLNKDSLLHPRLPMLPVNNSKHITRKKQDDDHIRKWLSSNDEEEDSISESEDSGEENKKDGVGTIKAKLIGTITHQNGVYLHFPIGVAVTPKDDIIICDTGNHLVWIVDKTGRPKMTIEGHGRATDLVRPAAVSTLKDGSFVIKDNNGLHFFDPNGIYIRGIGTDVLNRPFGLTTTDEERIVTLCETWKPSLYVFDKDGHIDRTSVFEPLINRPLNSKCRFMSSYQEELVVSDLGLSKIYRTTLDGKTILTFGCHGKDKGCMIQPSGITMDPKGTMLIADGKTDRVQIFDRVGEFLGALHFSHPIHRPSDITMTKDGRLFVLNYLDHYLGVYSLSHE